MKWLMWQEHQLQSEAWLNMSEDEDQQHNMMARAYDDYAENHHPLYRRRIQHAWNCGEHHVPGTRYSTDGYNPDTHTVYEFCGCYWHGFRTCQPQRTETHARLLKRSMEDVRLLVDRKKSTIIGPRVQARQNVGM